MTAQNQYIFLKQELNEIQWRHYLGTEALRLGYKGLIQVMQCSGADFKTIQRGIKEVTEGKLYHPGERIRKTGGGRKKLSAHNPEIVHVVEKTADPKGNSESTLRWTSYSMEHIANAVKKLGHTISPMSTYRILKNLGFALKANKKDIEGKKNHPDRNMQFQHINKLGLRFQLQGIPIISVDCKKKELLGNFKNQGKEWHPKGHDTKVNVYDFTSLADGKAIPYGIYDILQKVGFVNVGIDHDTAEFSVESIRRWWDSIGKDYYPQTHELYILCDGGGSNGAKNRLWKYGLQQLANETKVTIHISHYPPGTSKWNAIEHALFSFISINWRGKPLISLETVIELISHTTNKSGLSVTAMKDNNVYETGRKITDTQMEKLNIIKDNILGNWNYSIKPQA